MGYLQWKAWEIKSDIPPMVWTKENVIYFILKRIVMCISRVAMGLSSLRLGVLPGQFLGRFPEIIVRREYRTHARKNRNIFQEPDKVDAELKVRVPAVSLFLLLLSVLQHELIPAESL